MANLDVSVPTDVVDAFKQLKLERKYKYMIIYVNHDGISCRTGDVNSTFADFSKQFNSMLACYGIYDSETKKKIVLVHWNPHEAPVKNRLVTTTALRAIQESLIGLGVSQQVTDLTELKAACL